MTSRKRNETGDGCKADAGRGAGQEAFQAASSILAFFSAMLREARHSPLQTCGVSAVTRTRPCFPYC